MQILFPLIALWNIYVFLLFAQDKRRAIRRQWRISEKSLLLASAFFGGAGGFAGMVLLRHKTKHLRFRILIPLFLLLQLAALFAYFWFLDGFSNFFHSLSRSYSLFNG